jgi:sterol desaturase/sphingolipid hydroxylase (fatty acid hydroxylase superfamily)
MQRVPAEVAAYRAGCRAQMLGRFYSGWAHFAFSSLWAGGAIALCIARVRAPRWWELLIVPITFLYANRAEYRGHRGPMHHRRPGRLRARIFERHTVMHHRFYTHEAMSIESMRDAKMTLFPPVLILFFLGLSGLPVVLGLALLTTRNIAYLFGATAVGYFLCYEWLHFAYHLPERTLANLPFLRALRRHHQTHHDPARMQRWNFNVTFPIWDRLRGTCYRPDGEDVLK